MLVHSFTVTMQLQQETQSPIDPAAWTPLPSATEEFYSKIVTEIQKPRPESAKLATARFLNFIVPIVSASKWRKCFDGPDPISQMVSLVDSPWFLGRLSRCLTEMNADPAGKLAALNQMSWLRDIKIRENGVEFHFIDNFDELIALQLQSVLKQKASEQAVFWRAFSNGFNRALIPRKQDMKALPIYILFTIKWESFGGCQTMRELFEVVAQQLPAEQCPPGIDPVDFEDRQFKWFEKLCQRSLKISFKSRGRPVMSIKYPQQS